MRLTYKSITHNIVRCFLDEQAHVTVGPNERVTIDYFQCTEWNMSAVIAHSSTIHVGNESAAIEWRDTGPVKTSGDLEIEIAKQSEDESVVQEM